ncbi:hypothetical protein B2J95_21690 [Enterobacter cloacae]|nr:hypothetical protein B2J95_21690 [Enterobacter cloacae]PPV40230.1 hypothetical protein C4L14_03970 [Enterobacter sp. RC4]KAA3572960.1 hypothetical protein D1176_17655 [Enterobacter cloacae]KAA3577338.1 hypothetical protein D1177_10060 [Enterobacter cloacae]KAA3589473.1 hypothetical protein D1175_11985 [Enterobacter cloacae]
MASVSLRKGFVINQNHLCPDRRRCKLFTPVKLLIAWQFGAKYYVLTNKWRGSSPSSTRL